MASLIKILFLSFLMISILSTSFSQKPPMKYGKVDMADMEMTVYEKDSSASAVVLADFGKSYFSWDEINRFQLKFERHVRVKVLNKNGYDQGDVEVYLYHDGSNKEVLVGLKGTVYNLENGKIVKSKLDNKSIFEEVINNYSTATKFTMPNVREGSIIEYTYKISSDFYFNYREWEFQKEIPIIWSEYNASFPEYVHYQKVSQGYLPFKINTSEVKPKSIILVSQNNRGFGNQGGRTSTEKIDFQENHYKWVVEHAPAFVGEPYMTTYKNYISKISFELESTKFPNRPFNNVMGDWATLNKKLLESEYFGLKVKGSNFLKKQTELLTAGESTNLGKATAIYDYVKKTIEWNGYNSVYLNSNFKKPLEENKGNSAEINLLLASMLQKSGLNASPVLISTRSHGIVRTEYAISDQFNYVICKLDIDGKTMLLDATDQYLTMGVLPERCLNGKGWVVSEASSGWVDINTHNKRATRTVGNLELLETGILSGTIEHRYGGYRAHAPRKTYSTKGKEDYISDIKSKSSWNIKTLEIENNKELSKPFILKYDLELDSEAESLGEQIYFNPLIGNRMEVNPFKLEERQYPVDFACPLEEMYYMTYIIPDGYHVEEHPQQMAIALPDKAGVYLYTVTTQGNKLTIMSKLNINKTLFLPSEYPNIKEFYAQVVAKQNEQVVLKKD